MDLISFEKIPKSKKLETLSKEEIIQRCSVLEFELTELIKENYELRSLKITEEQIQLIMTEQLESLREELFGVSSEKYKKPKTEKEKDQPKEPSKPKVKKPSERYPNLPIRVQIIAMNPAPSCPCCEKLMNDSGMTEDSEQLTVIPKKYEIIEQKRVKYSCTCNGTLFTAPLPARIIPGSSYSDEMIQDVALTKYCDLIPMERYSAMAARSGVKDLPPHSLIELSHQFADFMSPAYKLIKKGALASRVLRADETPHRMLEGSDKKSWYLWGFSTPQFCFFECHDTRSGDVASDILLNSSCEVLVSDVFSGYGKAIRVANEVRRTAGKALIKNGNCNAHARRPFFKSWPKYKEAEFYLDHYHEIYRLNDAAKDQPPERILELRSQMKPRFEEMKKKAFEELPGYSEKSKYGKALNYFLGNYEGLTLFLTDPDVPIDNNSQEGLLRNPVVGRKTWYGTHSKDGALTAAVLFTIVESCKLIGVNPREYCAQLVKDLHAGLEAYTPYQFKNRK